MTDFRRIDLAHGKACGYRLWVKYEQYEKLLRRISELEHAPETSEQHPAVVPETLVAWVDERYWRCRCKPPGDITIASASFCRACGTARPELKAIEPPTPISELCPRCGRHMRIQLMGRSVCPICPL